MSREIKFRLHCGDTGEVLAYEKFNTSLNWGYYWHDAKLPKDDAICETSNYFRNKNPLGKIIRVEFTGLTDAKGAEVYEGDIIREGVRIREVKFSTEGVASCGCCFDDFSGSGFIAEDSSIQAGEVIGNIYQNPELLK